MEARAELAFKMPDASMTAAMHPNMPMAIMKQEMPEPPPKKAPSKKNRKKSELAKVEMQPKDEQEPFFTQEQTNG